MKLTKTEQDYNIVWVWCQDESYHYSATITFNGYGGGEILVFRRDSDAVDMEHSDLVSDEDVVAQILKLGSVEATHLECSRRSVSLWFFKYELLNKN